MKSVGDKIAMNKNVMIKAAQSQVLLVVKCIQGCVGFLYLFLIVDLLSGLFATKTAKLVT